jgi:hypothetical protein
MHGNSLPEIARRWLIFDLSLTEHARSGDEHELHSSCQTGMPALLLHNIGAIVIATCESSHFKRQECCKIAEVVAFSSLFGHFRCGRWVFPEQRNELRDICFSQYAESGRDDVASWADDNRKRK